MPGAPDATLGLDQTLASIAHKRAPGLAPAGVDAVSSVRGLERHIPDAVDPRENFDILSRTNELRTGYPTDNVILDLHSVFGAGRAHNVAETRNTAGNIVTPRSVDQPNPTTHPREFASFQRGTELVNNVTDVMRYFNVLSECHVRDRGLSMASLPQVLSERNLAPADWMRIQIDAPGHFLHLSGLDHFPMFHGLSAPDQVRLMNAMFAQDGQFFKRALKRFDDVSKQVLAIVHSPSEQATREARTKEVQATAAEAGLRTRVLASITALDNGAGWFTWPTTEITRRVDDLLHRRGNISQDVFLAQVRDVVFNTIDTSTTSTELRDVHLYHLALPQIRQIDEQIENVNRLLRTTTNATHIANLNTEILRLDNIRTVNFGGLITRYQSAAVASQREYYTSLLRELNGAEHRLTHVTDDIHEVVNNHNELRSAEQTLRLSDPTERLQEEERMRRKLETILPNAVTDFTMEERNVAVKAQETSRDVLLQTRRDELDRRMRNRISVNAVTGMGTINLTNISRDVEYLADCNPHEFDERVQRLILRDARIDVTAYMNRRVSPPVVYTPDQFRDIPFAELSFTDRAHLEELTTTYKDAYMQILRSDIKIVQMTARRNGSWFMFWRRGRLPFRHTGTDTTTRDMLEVFTERTNQYDTSLMDGLLRDRASQPIIKRLAERKIEQGSEEWIRILLNELTASGTDARRGIHVVPTATP